MEPKVLRIKTGNKAIFRCTSSVYIQWFFTTALDTYELKGENSEYLSIKNVQPNSTGLYTCYGLYANNLRFISVAKLYIMGNLVTLSCTLFYIIILITHFKLFDNGGIIVIVLL